MSEASFVIDDSVSLDRVVELINDAVEVESSSSWEGDRSVPGGTRRVRLIDEATETVLVTIPPGYPIEEIEEEWRGRYVDDDLEMDFRVRFEDVDDNIATFSIEYV